MKGMPDHQEERPGQTVHAVRRTDQPGLKFNYELFNCNNFNIRYWSWNYRGCWPVKTRVCLATQPPTELREMGTRSIASLSGGQARPLSNLFVTTKRPPTPLRALHRQSQSRPWVALLGISIDLCDQARSLPRSRLSRRHPPIFHAGCID